MSETRKAYRVVLHDAMLIDGRQRKPPVCEEVAIIITPKRVAVQDRYGLSYYDPHKFWLRYKETPVDAWLLFLDEQRKERNTLEERLAFTNEQIKAGEAYFDSISPFRTPEE